MRRDTEFSVYWNYLRENAVHSLVSPFDVHMTLQHLLHLVPPAQSNRAKDSPTQSDTRTDGERLSPFKEFMQLGAFAHASSLFVPVSPSGTCGEVISLCTWEHIEVL